MGFYKSFFLLNAVALIILLAFMAVILTNRTKSQTFPATLSNCPDFYSVTPQNECIMEQSVYSSRSPECTSMYPGTLSFSDKKSWASGCGVAWDGITNSSIT
jgi:hypothetical protein